MSHATKSVRPRVAVRHPSLASISALLNLLYAAAVYLFFLVVLGYAVGFFIGFGVPKGIDQGTRAAVPVQAPLDTHRASTRRADDVRVVRKPGAEAVPRPGLHLLPGPRARADPRPSARSQRSTQNERENTI